MKVCPRCDARFEGPGWACNSCSWSAPLHETVHVIASGGAAGFASEFFDALPDLEQGHFWFDNRNALIVWAVRRYFPEARTFLEVGCGTGQVTGALLAALPHLRFTASEAFLEGLLVARSKARGAELVQAVVERLPWEAEFDLVGAFDVLEHVTDHVAAAHQIARAIKPGGGVIVTVPQHRWLWSPLDDYSRHQRRYTRGELVSLLEGAGFAIERVSSFVSLLLPVLLASRLAQQGRPVDAAREYRIGPVTNGLGAAALKVERGLIRAGLSFPAGGSLLAVARRQRHT